MSDASPRARGPRLIDSMPRPLLVAFAVLAIAGLAVVVALLVRPPSFGTVALEDRRPPGRGTLSHDPGRVTPVPEPSGAGPTTTLGTACGRIAVHGGIGFKQKMRGVAVSACSLAGRGVAASVGEALKGLDGAAVRLARFERTGVESTLDFSTRTILLNFKLSARELPATHVVPVLIHEGWHLARADRRITAEEELGARRAEAAACREVVPIESWPRWCEDAARLAELPEARAIELLVSAGYPS